MVRRTDKRELYDRLCDWLNASNEKMRLDISLTWTIICKNDIQYSIKYHRFKTWFINQMFILSICNQAINNQSNRRCSLAISWIWQSNMNMPHYRVNHSFSLIIDVLKIVIKLIQNTHNIPVSSLRPDMHSDVTFHLPSRLCQQSDDRWKW